MEKGQATYLIPVVYQNTHYICTYFYDLIIANHSRPKILFSVIKSVVDPPGNTMSAASDALCGSFM